jgi:hypothetical protein
MKGGFDFDYYLTVDHLGSGRPAEAVKRALLRVYYTCLHYSGANGGHRPCGEREL